MCVFVHVYRGKAAFQAAFKKNTNDSLFAARIAGLPGRGCTPELCLEDADSK